MLSADPLFALIAAVVVAALMCAVLILSLVNLRRPATTPMAVAGVLVAIAFVLILVAPPSGMPVAQRIAIAVLGAAAATIGGNPFTRRALDIATGDRVRETADGGILIIASNGADAEQARTLMRGGTVIGYLERISTVAAIALGFPEAVAAVIAVKGIGRFPELAESEARERFIIGTLASLLWAGLIGAIIRLSLG